MKTTAVFCSSLVFALALAAAVPAASAQQFIIQPTTEADSKDAKIYDNQPDSSLQSNLNVVSPEIARFYGLVQFTLPSTATLPAANITSATLTLYCSGLGVSGGPAVGGTVSLRQITSPWRENATDAGTAPLSTFNNFFGAAPTITIGNVVASQVVNGAGFVTWDITSTVQAWQSGALVNNGIFIELSTVGGDVGFADVDSAPAVAGSQPKLTINPVPEPSSVTAACLGGLALLAASRRLRRRSVA